MKRKRAVNKSLFYVSVFQKDYQGHDVFFPWGRLGKGYLVTDLKRKKRLEKYYFFSLFIGVLIGMVLIQIHFSWALIFGIFCGYYFIYNFLMSFLLTDLPIAEIEYDAKLDNQMRTKSFEFSSNGIWVVLSMCVFAFLLTIYFMITQPDDRANPAFFITSILLGLGIVFSFFWIARKGRLKRG